MTRLRAVELHGYKSFAARTSLRFDESVTAIVGPNGSGKSNVMDALRWAIGAGAGRALRTRRAEDVIFSGGHDRGASGFAEVRIQFDNRDRWLDFDAAEIEVVRRVHRDGQSEVRVNGRAARLRDVQDLFRNSGLGAGGFALMSQGLVDEMLRLRPHERRQTIEEVAGVRQHRHQMVESQRRRARAQEHLERARLLRDELAPRLRSLKRSARRARQFAELQRQLDEAQQHYFAVAAAESEHDLLARRGAARSAEAARASAEVRRDEATKQLASTERDAALARHEVEECAASLSAARSELRSLEHQRELDEQRQTWLRGEIADLDARMDRDHGAASTRDAQSIEEALAALNHSLSAARRRRDSIERERAAASVRHQRAVADISSARSKAAQLARRRRAAGAQTALLAIDLATAERRAATADAQLRSSQRELECAQRGASLARERFEEAQRTRTSLRRQLEQINSRIEAVERRQAPVDRLRGIVLERLPEAAQADAVFGELMDAALYDGLDAAIAAARAGLAADSGRVTAIDAGRAVELVESMIDAVSFVDGIEQVKRAASAGRTAVTPSGIVIRPDGVVQSGGTQPGARQMREQLNELRVEREALCAKLDALADEPALQAGVNEYGAALTAAQAELERQRASASRAATALEQAKRCSALVIAEMRRVRVETAQWRKKLDQARHELRQSAEALQVASSPEPIDIAALEQERDRLAAELAEARALRAADERRRADRARLSSLRRELDVVETSIRDREPQLEIAAATANDRAKLDAANAQLEHAADRRAQAAADLERLQQARLTAERDAIEASAALREAESARARLAAEAAAEGVELGALHHSAPSARDLNGGRPLVSNGSERSAVALATPSGSDMRAAVVELRAKLQRLGPVDPGAAREFEMEEARWQEIDAQIADLEATEASLQAAERELELLIERRFRQACREVDEAFQRCFQVMFRGGTARLVLTEADVEAEDDASAGEERRRVGVEIKAQPPGKRVSALGLLSGGERALTAIALLFALLEVRPAPFCILDEVDAALDEANVERFVSALRERAAKTQFVVITHNRRTIEQADSIYGVTMGASGVSRLLSVRVDDLPKRNG